MIDVKELIAKHQRKLDVLNTRFVEKNKAYQEHRNIGAEMEKGLNELSLEVRDQEKVIENYKRDFELPDEKKSSKKKSDKDNK
jgi:chromosome segregation ATPase